MWKVTDRDKFVRGIFNSLDLALEAAKYIDEYVIITDGVTEFVGMFGVDEVKDPEYNGWISRKKERAQIAQSVEAPVSKAV